ncbi:MAG: hypothetical protein ACRDXX_12215 [Stackebrandtia sp.]
MTVDFAALRNADIGALELLAEAWSAVGSKMTDARSSYDNVNSYMFSDDWTGAAAEQACTRNTELLELINAGITESETIRDILGDAVERFRTAKTTLTDLVEAIDGISQLEISSSGQVSLTPGSEGDVWTHYRDQYQSDIDQAVEDAQTADGEVSEALALAGETANLSDNTFNGQALDVEGLQQAREDAETAAGVLLSSELPTHEQEQELERLLAANSDNPAFAEHLMSELGSDGFAAAAGMLGTSVGPQNSDDIIPLLGETLATATNPDLQPSLSEGWTRSLMQDSWAYYPEISRLLEHGEYHEDFIVPIAEHMIQMENSSDPELPPWDPGDGSPLHSALTAIERNPEAATALLSGSRDYQDMPYVDSTGERIELIDEDFNTVDYLLGEDNIAFSDVEDLNSSELATTVGNVLEAGATGMPAGTPAELPRVEHTPEMAAVTERIVEYVGANPDAVENSYSPVRASMDNLGRITVNYMEDFHRAFADTTADSAWQPSSHGTPLDLGDYSPDGQQDLKQYLQVLGHSEEAGQLVWEASLGTTYNNVYEATAMDGSNAIHQMHAIEPHSRLMAEVSNGQFEAIRDENLREASHHNFNLDVLGEAVSRGGHMLGPVGDGLSWGAGGVIDGFREDGMAAAAEDQAAYADEMKGQFDTQVLELAEQAMRAGGATDEQIQNDLAMIVENSSNWYRAELSPVQDEEGRRADGD